MPLVRSKIRIAVSVLIMLVTACGAGEPGATGSILDQNQPGSASPQPETESTRSLESILALIPDTELSREHVLIDDIAARRQLLDIPLPDTNTSEDALNDYSRSLAHLSPVPVTRDYGQLITGFPENGGSYRLKEQVGFDLRNADQSIHIRGDRYRLMELILGRFNPELTDELIASCGNCVPVDRLSHEGAGYYSWMVGRQYGDFGLAPPVTDYSGEGGFFWFTDSMAVRALHQTDMEKVIERAESGTPSLLDDADYALAASLLDQDNRIDAIFSGRTLSLGLALRDLRKTIEHQGEHFDAVDDLEGTLRGPGLLLPYQLHASSVRIEDGVFVVTNVLIHDSEDAAQANATRLTSRIEDGESPRGERWTDLLDSYDVTVSGRAVIAEFRADDTVVTFLRVLPTDTPSRLDQLYSSLFTHENMPGSPDLDLRLPTPAPTPTSSAPGTKVGEQEPACLDRGAGGSYRDGFNRIYWFLHPPEPGTTDAQAVAQHLCIRGGEWVPDGRIIVRQADFLWSDLTEWRRDPVMWSVEGAYSNDVDETQNRIVVQVRTPYAAEQLKKNIAASEVPVEAVIIAVDKQVGLDDPPAEPVGKSGIEITVEFGPEAKVGTEVEFYVVLTNRSDRILEIEHGSPPEADIIVLTADGRQVWRHLGPIIAGTGASTTLEPGEEVRFPVTWSQMDLDGFPVPAGHYMVRGSARFSHNDDSLVTIELLRTGPSPLELIR